MVAALIEVAGLNTLNARLVDLQSIEAKPGAPLVYVVWLGP
jgi:hypothetical protein